MLSHPDRLSETDIRGPGSKTWTVRRDDLDSRPWLLHAPVCPLLAQHHILHLGWCIAMSPFEIVRMKLGGSYFLACWDGAGEVLVDGRWQSCGPGQAFLLPPGTLHAFRALPKKSWSFGWVRYDEGVGQSPVASAHSPVLAHWESQAYLLALQGLYAECTHDAIAMNIGAWIDLIHGYVMQFARPRSMDPRIMQLWERVACSLEQEWDNTSLAKEVQLSEKQLERLCRRILGRTPRQHLIWLRMRHAAELLSTTNEKIETIARRVGYQNPFVFSTTFKRYLGWSPSDYPKR